MGLICHHREAYECGAASNDCSSVLSSFTGGISAFVSSLDCICDACPNAKLVFAHQAEVAMFYTQCLTAIVSGSGTQDCSTDLDVHLGAICPMITTIECLTSEAACGALSSQLVLNQLSDLKSECEARQVPVDYVVNYTYRDACVTLSEISSTVGLLQLKLLALGSSLLLSILVEWEYTIVYSSEESLLSDTANLVRVPWARCDPMGSTAFCHQFWATPSHGMCFLELFYP